jgi:DNA modification methylase
MVTRLPPRSTGVDGWYRYYAGFPSTFVEHVLRRYASTGREKVLDPWNGCGTTTYIARNLGFPSIGLDSNPFVCCVAAAKLITYEDAKEIFNILESAIQKAMRQDNRDITEDDPLLEWFEPGTAALVRSITDVITRSMVTQQKASLPSPQACFTLLCLIRALLNMGVSRRASNPTWTMPGDRRFLALDNLARTWSDVVSHCLCDVVRRQAPWPESIVLTRDSRSLGLDDESIDLVITSPPYCTRIDYAVKTKFELAVMGLESKAEFTELRYQLMGTTCIRLKNHVVIPHTWATHVRDILERVYNHPSQASSSYYFKNLWQYFDDAHRSLSELNRVLKPGGRAIAVLRSSYYKEILFDLPDLYLDMAKHCGMQGDMLFTSQVRTSFSTINPSTRRYGGTRAYHESVITFYKPLDGSK